MEESDITIDTVIENLLKTDILKRIMCRNGREFTYRLAYWLIRYILVLSSKYESGEEDFEDILYYLHGDNFWEIIELSNIFMDNQSDTGETSIMN